MAELKCYPEFTKDCYERIYKTQSVFRPKPGKRLLIFPPAGMPAYWPWNCASRFSLKAATPSLKSLVRPAIFCAMRSLFNCSS